MSGLLVLCSRLGRLSSALVGLVGLLGLVAPLSLLGAVEASGLVFGPRMDYDEWTPLGHGDPLKNDPTYDYVPPVLERVHYWMEENTARRDSTADNFVKFVDNSVPVPPTMLVPPPLPPLPPQPSTTAAPAPAPSSYSSLNPFHPFEDRPVVHNVHFEEKPFDREVVSNGFEDGRPHHFNDKKILPFDVQPAAGNVVVFDGEKPGSASGGDRPSKLSFDDKPSMIRGNPLKVASPMVPQVAVEEKRTPPPPPARLEEQSPISNFIAGSGAPDTAESLPGPVTPPPPATTASSLPPPPTPTRPAPMGAAPRPPTPGPTPGGDSISSLIRGLLKQEAATTMTALTTDPLFAHYKQPVTPVNGPAYLIIQGHSKVKTYGASRMPSPHGHSHIDLNHHNNLLAPASAPAPRRPGRPGHRARRRAAD